VFTKAYQHLLGSIQNRDHAIDLRMLNLPTHDMQDPEGVFSGRGLEGDQRAATR
jgi:hypothetical protein